MKIRNLFFAILLIFSSMLLVYADSNGIWIKSEDVLPGIFGLDDVFGNYSFLSNVGIGTSSPKARLEIYNEEDTPEIIIGTSNGGVAEIGTIEFVHNNQKYWNIYSDGTSNEFGILSFNESNEQTNHRFTIAKDTGFVGIGTRNPNSKLHVEGGDIETSGNILAAGIEADTIRSKSGGNVVIIIG